MTTKTSPSLARLQKLLADGVPKSAIKSLRAERTQANVSAKSGVSRPYLSQLEAGDKLLTSTTAQKLGPALGVTSGELELAEMLASTKRRALKGKIDPHMLLEMVEQLSEQLPDNQLGERVLDAMVHILSDALAQYEPESPLSFSTESRARAAVKAARQTDRRDKRGVRLDKVHAPHDGGDRK